MRFKRLDLNLVVVLDALLAERSVTKAGVRLHVSQTTVSDALARLRDYFGDELLVQVGRKMVPTPLGESLISPARGLLLQAEAMLNTRPSFDPTAAVRRFTLMVSDYVSTVLISKAIPVISNLAPKVTIELLPHSTDPMEALDHGEADFLIIPDAFIKKTHPHRALFTDTFSCIAWTENALLDKRLSQEQFLDMGHVVARFGSNRAPSIEEWFFQRYGSARRIEMIALNFSSVPQLIAGTSRIATIPTELAKHASKFLPIKILEHSFELPAITEAIQWHRFSDTDPGMQWMRDILVETSAKNMHSPA